MNKIMFQPLDYWQINQKFGENKACIPLVGGAVITCDGNNPPEGYRSIYGENGHQGLDLGANYWTPVFCAQEGTVNYIDTNEKSGYDVRILSDKEDFEFTHIYEHLNKWNVKVGQKVKTGQIIGWVGSTGYSSGPHLHFECRDKYGMPFNPIPRMEQIKASDILKINSSLDNIKQQVTILADRIKLFLSTVKKIN